jgi:hypothetical protein
MNFIGHGAFGFITKPTWVNYFGVVGIDEAWSYRLMPVVGLVDVLVGLLTLLSPRRAVLAYMTFWGLWTAVLRPLSGESFFETLERAGNYGVPMAMLLAIASRPGIGGWFGRCRPLELAAASGAREQRRRTLAAVLRATTALLLIGHGGYGAVMHKTMLETHYAAAGLSSLGIDPPTLVTAIGCFEIALGVAVAAMPATPLLIFVLLWKLATEMLYPIAGDPVWEFIERGGSYGAPLALAILNAARTAEPARSAAPVPAPAPGAG